MRRIAIVGAVSLAALLMVGTAMAAVIVVTPQGNNGWFFQTVGGTASGGFENGPGAPPMGTGSLELKVGANGDDFVAYRNINYSGTLLSSLTAMNYSTYISAHNGCVAPYIVLSIDINGDGIFDPTPGNDDALFFEPCYQNGTYVTDPPGQLIPPQNGGGPNPTTVGSWQYWDAYIGGWWSANYGGAGGPPLTTLATYISLHPGAKIINTDSCLGGVRLRAGPGAPVWSNFEGNVDAFTIGVSGNNTTYDFESGPLPVATCSPAQPPSQKVGGTIQFVDDDPMALADAKSTSDWERQVAFPALAIVGIIVVAGGAWLTRRPLGR